MTCASCGHVNVEGQKFCGECGSPLEVVCSSCATSNPPGQRFCGSVVRLLRRRPALRRTRALTAPAPASERRLVSILFADIVGHTAFSEDRDAEDVRELLSRYFDAARTVIERYGGTVEKFIGDAVMAVWGTPIAQEDDAERAVRAALDLLAAVSRSDRRSVRPSFARVPACSRVKLRSRSAPRARAWSPAISSIPRHGSSLRPSPEPSWSARPRSVRRKPPSSSRARAATRSRARPSRSSSGRQCGSSASSVERRSPRSRAAVRRSRPRAAARQGALPRHRGREPVPARLGRRDRRHRKVAAHLGVREVRRRAGRRRLVALRTLSGVRRRRRVLGAGRDGSRARRDPRGRGDGERPREAARRGREAHSGSTGTAFRRAAARAPPRAGRRRRWRPGEPLRRRRIFFERLAQTGPTVMVFEDIHWADSALLDFIEYLVEWSRDVPLFVLTLSRPDLQDRRPTWGRESGTSPRSSSSRSRLKPWRYC